MASITAAFDSGNIEVVSIEQNGEQLSATLNIRFDPFTQTDQKAHAMWFHFKVTGAKGVPCTFTIANAGKCSYSSAWHGYRACYSTDRETWLRCPTSYNGSELAISLAPGGDAVWLAYFAPFSYEQHQKLVAWCGTKSCRVRSLGKSLDGRDIEVIEAGDGDKIAWIIGRQHPGESMAEYWMRGFLHRLLNPNDALGRDLLVSRITNLLYFFLINTFVLF